MISLHFLFISVLICKMKGWSTYSPRSLPPLKFYDTDLLILLEISYYIIQYTTSIIADVAFLLTIQGL